MLFYTTTGSMMWSFRVSLLLLGVQPVLYDLNPGYPAPDVLWRLVQDARVTSFGASPAYVDALNRAGVVPGRDFDLSALRAVMLAGSPGSPGRSLEAYVCFARQWPTVEEWNTCGCPRRRS